MKCNFEGLSRDRAQEILINIIPKYLEFLLEKNISEQGKVYLTEETEDKFRIGFKRDGNWIYGKYFDLNNISEARIDILDKLDFISGFMID